MYYKGKWCTAGGKDPLFGHVDGFQIDPNNYGGKDMMYRTELLEEITIENATVKINAKIEEMEKESYRLVTMSFWGTERAVLVFKKGLKGSLL